MSQREAVKLPRSERTAFWASASRGWSVFFYVIVGIIVIGTLAGPTAGADRTASLVCLGLLVLAFTLVGRHAAACGEPAWANAYLLILVVLTTAQVGFDKFGAALLFVAYSQIWFFAEKRWQGVAWTALLSVAVAGRLTVATLRAHADPMPGLAQMAVALAFSIALGLWVTWIAEQSEERAELLRRLQAAQDELAATHHAAGVVAERERMAQEIHDTLAQGFTSVVMLAQTTAAELERGHDEAALARVDQIEQVARQNLAEARALVAAFGPADLADATLGEALSRLAERFTAQTGVPVALTPGTQHATSGLGRDVQVVLLRSAQEAMANVRRHAGATRVTLGLARDDGAVRLEVADDGRGFGPDAAEGQGLRGMRERARATGGDLAVDSTPGTGTRLTLTIPLAAGPTPVATDEAAAGPTPAAADELAAEPSKERAAR
jgi:signal transduction histidine kinase